MKIFLQALFFLALPPCLGQSTLTDATTGCKFSIPWVCDMCTVEWTGDCIDSLPNGNGVLTVQYESEEVFRYSGHMLNGAFDGFGRYKDAASELEGYFMNGNFFSPRLFNLW